MDWYATEPDGTVRLTVDSDDKMIRLLVQDDGPGMAAEVLNRGWRTFLHNQGTGSGYGTGALSRSQRRRATGRNNTTELRTWQRSDCGRPDSDGGLMTCVFQ